MDNSLLNRAFDVEGISHDFNPDEPPSTGHEYLQHVMYEASKCPKVVVAEIEAKYEASKCPKVVVAEIDRSKIKNHISINVGLEDQINEENLAPCVDWEQHQIAIFSDLRRKVEISKKSKKFKPLILPKLNDEEKWYNICFGESSNLEPSLTLLLSMSEPLLGRVLEYQLQWLADGLKPNQGKWIYALLACLNLPVAPVTCSVLRDLARRCAQIRCSESSLEESALTTLNLIICLVRLYFGQWDLMA